MTTPHGRAAPASASRFRTRQADRPRWERPAFWALLLATGVLYLWSLGASGYANSFYSAAAQAGGADWKAFLFGSLDAGNAITVDKPPAALWPMGLSVRLFGLGSWQILVPQALMGVATVGVLFAAVRRRVGPGGGLLAGAVLACTPVAALMFRFNNPDALLCLLMVCALYCAERAVEDARTKWLVLAGVCFGCAFLVKTLQAWLILPVVAVVYLVCGPTPLRRRLWQLLLGGLSTLAAAGWWVALAELWPAGSRPYIGGSQTDSFLELTLGYNGFGRITGDETGSVGGGGGWGETGLTRLLDAETGGQISWLLPAALLLLAAGLLLTRRAARTDRKRASFLLWGGSLLCTGVVFSFMSGIFHAYYTVALAPYVAALVALGGVSVWRARERVWCAVVLAVAVGGTAAWSYALLARSPEWFPWLRWAVLAAGVLAACGLLAVRVAPRGLTAGLAVVGLLAAVAGPAAYAFSTAATPHTGSIVSAGPGDARGGPGAGPPGGGPDGKGKGAPDGQGPSGGSAGQPPQPGGGVKGDGRGPGNRPGGQGPGEGQGNSQQGQGRPAGGPGGGLLDGGSVSAKAETLLKKDASSYTWVAAATGSQNAASYQLATGAPVMAIGGFNGSDPSPTLAEFRQYVEDGRVHYFLAGGTGGPSGGQGSASRISTWVQAHFEKVKVGDATFYDLTKRK
ncbi:ArnT family glycosyltransferase [Streptomyces sulphureus]|uniref:ArnT family glycosyltransferase n=1 Tax=Streptomyces sulphureus TaxID=47758 RepID=UPI000368D464|nr:glycosyltransferase family 39 protein [Streptomyces sulphureus]